jgi:hypothetical protein
MAGFFCLFRILLHPACLAFVMPRTRKKKGIFSPTISAQQQGVFISGR